MLKRLLVILLFVIPVVTAVSNVQHSIDGDKITLTYDGNPPFLINIRGDQNIGQDGGYVWAKTYSKTFTIDMGFVVNKPDTFYYGVKDGGGWSGTKEILQSNINEYCKELVILGHSNNPNDSKKINLVFIAGGSNNLTPIQTFNFTDLFKSMIIGKKSTASELEDAEGLIGIEPYSSNLEKFNFWYINITLFDEGDPCKQIKLIGGRICNNGQVIENGIGTPLDHPFVIYDYSKLIDYCNFPNKFISIFYKQTQIVNTPAGHQADLESKSMISLLFGFGSTEFTHDFNTFIHEFTHSFAKVYDEKSSPNLQPLETTPWTMSNCFSLGIPMTTAECAASDKLPWHDLIGNGCGKDGIVDCQIDTSKSYYNKNDQWIYEVRDDVEGCGKGCQYQNSHNLFRPFMGCNVMSSCDLLYTKYGLVYSGKIHKLGVINEREACRRIKSLTGSVSDYCKKLCLEGCTFGERCVQGVCTKKELIK